MEQEKLKALFKKVINETESNNITTIQEIIYHLANEMQKVKV